MTGVARKLKNRELEGKILGLIEKGSLKAGDALCGERELCSRFKVSRNTVRSAIEELERQNLLERIPGKGTFVKSQTPEGRDIGILIPVMDYFYPAAIQGAAEILQSNGFRMVVGASNDDSGTELELLKRLAATQEVAGVIIGASTNCDFNEVLDTLAGKPVVFIDHAPENLPCDCVLSDHFAGAFEATRELLKLGHRRIACAGSSEDDPAAWVGLRAKGYAHALEDAGIPFDKNLSRRGKWFETCDDPEFLDFFKCENHPTAIFATNDRTASNLLSRLREAGLKVPDDVAVIGYDDEPFATTLRPALASIATPKGELGERAAALLLERLKNREKENFHRELLRPTLARRASLGFEKDVKNREEAS